MIEIMIDLQGGAKAPLYEKIYEYIKRDVIAGKISINKTFVKTFVCKQKYRGNGI